MDNDANKKWFVVDQARTWFLGVIYQGNRLIYTSCQLANPQNIRDHKSYLSTKSVYDIEAYFFVLALYKSYEFLKLSSSYYEKINEIYKHIIKVYDYSQVKDLRDMYTHVVDYVNEKGYAQDRYETFDGTTRSDAISTIIDKDGIKLGNRINANLIINKYNQLHEQFTFVCSRYLDSLHGIDS